MSALRQPSPAHTGEDASPVSHPAPAAFAALNTLPCTSRREKDESYYRVIVRLSDKSRVIECSDGIQWIIQYLSGRLWRGVSFHRDRDVLIERSGATGDALAVLQALPARHGYVEPVIPDSTPFEPAGSPAPHEVAPPHTAQPWTTAPSPARPRGV
jgi:hypothetical protein